MPRFLIHFYETWVDFGKDNINAIAGADTLDELIKTLDEAADEYEVVKVFILRDGNYVRILTANLREWRELRDEERRQNNKIGLRKQGTLGKSKSGRNKSQRAGEQCSK